MNSKTVYLITAIEFLWFMHERYSAISILHIILFIRIPNSSRFPLTSCLWIIDGFLNSLWSSNNWLIKRRKYYLLCILVALPLPAAFVAKLYTSISSGSLKSTHLMHFVWIVRSYYMLDRCQTSQLNSIYSMFPWNLKRTSVWSMQFW